jgi:proteasome lid subunit RPN8/RPN11
MKNLSTILLVVACSVCAVIPGLHAQSVPLNIKLNYKDQQVNGQFKVSVSPQPDREGVIAFPEKESRQINLQLSALDFGAPELNASLKLIVTPDAFQFTNCNPPEFKKLIFLPGKTISIPIGVENKGTVNVQISFKIKKFRDGSNQDAELSSADEFKQDLVIQNASSSTASTNNSTTETAPNPTAEQPEKNNASRQNKNQTEETTSKDLVIFNRAMNLTGQARVDALRSFIKRYKDSPKVTEAKIYLPAECSAKQLNDSCWQYVLHNAIEPKIDSINNAKGVRILKDLENHGGDYYLEFVYRRGAPSAIFISDPQKGIEDFRFDTIMLSSGMSVLQAALIASGGNYGLKLVGGAAPFRLDYYFNDERVPKLSTPISKTDTTILLNVSEIRKIWGGFGNLTLTVLQRKENLIIEVPGAIEIPEPTNPFLYIGIGLALILAIFLITRLRRQAGRMAMKAKLDKNAENTAQINADHDPMLQVKEDEHPKELSSTEQAPVFTSGSLRIKSVSSTRQLDKKSLTEENFDQLLQQGVYYEFDMRNMWTDTVLTEIFASKKSIMGIDGFLRGQRAQHLEEEEGSMPEIGGFLMGKYCLSADNSRYKVLLEEFVPIIPEENNVYQLHFSTESLVRELGDMQDEYPNLFVVGWFHTHPGHGLFLSKPDMTIHDGFFREPFQFAMEIDTRTENLDTGFFTRMASGAVNNQDSRIPGAKWFDWTEVEKVTRRR